MKNVIVSLFNVFVTSLTRDGKPMHHMFICFNSAHWLELKCNMRVNKLYDSVCCMVCLRHILFPMCNWQGWWYRLACDYENICELFHVLISCGKDHDIPIAVSLFSLTENVISMETPVVVESVWWPCNFLAQWHLQPSVTASTMAFLIRDDFTPCAGTIICRVRWI